jgi:hypothetical protein
MAGGLARQAYCGCISQATSYCETDALLLLFCGCDPAYMPPAMPLVSLNADPGALDVDACANSPRSSFDFRRERRRRWRCWRKVGQARDYNLQRGNQRNEHYLVLLAFGSLANLMAAFHPKPPLASCQRSTHCWLLRGNSELPIVAAASNRPHFTPSRRTALFSSSTLEYISVTNCS